MCTRGSCAIDVIGVSDVSDVSDVCDINGHVYVCSESIAGIAGIAQGGVSGRDPRRKRAAVGTAATARWRRRGAHHLNWIGSRACASVSPPARTTSSTS